MPVRETDLAQGERGEALSLSLSEETGGGDPTGLPLHIQPLLLCDLTGKEGEEEEGGRGRKSLVGENGGGGGGGGREDGGGLPACFCSVSYMPTCLPACLPAPPRLPAAF